jgi:hypothetical protein
MIKMRAKQQAALEKRFGKQEVKRHIAAASAVPKKTGAMEQASRENLGWRTLDAQQEFLRWD